VLHERLQELEDALELEQQRRLASDAEASELRRQKQTLASELHAARNEIEAARTKPHSEPPVSQAPPSQAERDEQLERNDQLELRRTRELMYLRTELASANAELKRREAELERLVREVEVHIEESARDTQELRAKLETAEHTATRLREEAKQLESAAARGRTDLEDVLKAHELEIETLESKLRDAAAAHEATKQLAEARFETAKELLYRADVEVDLPLQLDALSHRLAVAEAELVARQWRIDELVARASLPTNGHARARASTAAEGNANNQSADEDAGT
jgi:chromosome segregation ATPase